MISRPHKYSLIPQLLIGVRIEQPLPSILSRVAVFIYADFVTETVPQIDDIYGMAILTLLLSAQDRQAGSTEQVL